MTPTETKAKEQVEKLLLPRFKVIALWPSTDFKLGEIVGVYLPLGDSAIEFYEEYPHLFKKLEWWEERKPEELPEYVKTANTVKKVHCIVRGKIYFTKQKFRSANRYLPATKSDYDNYIQNL
jgi:hypothetical protein